MTNAGIVSVVGARPQFVKAAIVSKALATAGIEECVVHTGQHYDSSMSGGLIRELGIRNIVQNFEVGSGSHASQSAAIMNKFDEFLDRNPAVRCVMVYGDTNSTLAAGLVGAKRGLRVIHVEAGLRSFNRTMPEEVNRVVVDHLSDLLFCSSDTGVDNLEDEGIQSGVHMVGDVMLDAFNYYSAAAHREKPAAALLNEFQSHPPVLVTLHRPSNTDDPERFEQIVKSIGRLKASCIWPIHPRVQHQMDRIAKESNIVVCPPLSYLQILHVLSACSGVLTDSGGLQKEAYWAKCPCYTLRNETEWTETVDIGWNRLIEPEALESYEFLRTTSESHPWSPLYGDGKATARIARVLSQVAIPG